MGVVALYDIYRKRAWGELKVFWSGGEMKKTYFSSCMACRKIRRSGKII